MKQLRLFIFLFCIAGISNAQTAKDIRAGDSLIKATSKAFKDSLGKIFFPKAVYPLIKSSKWSGVIPVAGVDEKPDINQQYKLLMEVTTGIKDSGGAGEINDAIAEVGRLMNLHIAAGIPKGNIDIVVVAHGPVLRSFYNDSVYKKKYKVDNPNIPLFNELLSAGVKFIACGQAMFMYNIKKDELLPWMKVALSAQTVLTSYQLKGFIYKKIETDK